MMQVCPYESIRERRNMGYKGSQTGTRFPKCFGQDETHLSEKSSISLLLSSALAESGLWKSCRHCKFRDRCINYKSWSYQ